MPRQKKLPQPEAKVPHANGINIRLSQINVPVVIASSSDAVAMLKWLFEDQITFAGSKSTELKIR